MTRFSVFRCYLWKVADFSKVYHRIECPDRFLRSLVDDHRTARRFHCVTAKHLIGIPTSVVPMIDFSKDSNWQKCPTFEIFLDRDIHQMARERSYKFFFSNILESNILPSTYVKRSYQAATGTDTFPPAQNVNFPLASLILATFHIFFSKQSCSKLFEKKFIVFSVLSLEISGYHFWKCGEK